jgi:hypothetical protein
LVAGILAAVIGAGIFTGWTVFESSGQLADPVGLFVITFTVALLVCFIGGVFLGLPLTLLFRAMNVETLAVYTIAGLIVGSVAAAPLFLGSLLPKTGSEALAIMCVGGIPGAVAGFVWWRMSRKVAALTDN